MLDEFVTDRKLHPEERLLVAVIQAAMADAKTGLQDAVLFLTSDSGSWAQSRRTWLGFTSLDDELIRRTFEKRFPPPSPAQPSLTSLRPCREGSKQAALVDALARPEGATRQDLLDACAPWAWSAVTSAMYNDLATKGYSFRKKEDRYFLVLPAGVDAPVPHKRPDPPPPPTPHQVDTARRVQEATGRSLIDMEPAEIVEVCTRLDIKTERGRALQYQTAHDLKRRVLAAT